MKYVVVGLVALIAVPGATLAAAILAARLTARALGVPRFRLGTPSSATTLWKHWSVRGASVAAAFLACFLLAFSGTLFTGTLHPTMAVNVHEGPARQAGVQDGDRIVAIDGKHCPTFDVLRDELRTGSGPRNITFDRKGERITLVVAPTAEGRIGVEQRAERRRSTASEAIRWGFRMTTVPFRYLSQAFSVVSGSERPTLSGPVGIVKETSRQKSTDFGAVLGMAALLASFVWPVLVVVHGLDAFLSSRGRRAGGDQ